MLLWHLCGWSVDRVSVKLMFWVWSNWYHGRSKFTGEWSHVESSNAGLCCCWFVGRENQKIIFIMENGDAVPSSPTNKVISSLLSCSGSLNVQDIVLRADGIWWLRGISEPASLFVTVVISLSGRWNALSAIKPDDCLRYSSCLTSLLRLHLHVNWRMILSSHEKPTHSILSSLLFCGRF